VPAVADIERQKRCDGTQGANYRNSEGEEDDCLDDEM